MGFLTPKSCCACISLRTGTLIILVLSIIGSFMSVFGYGNRDLLIIYSDMKLEILLLIRAIIDSVIALAALIGVFNRATGILGFYVYYFTFELLCSTVIYLLFIHKYISNEYVFTYLIIIFILIIIDIYFICVINSYRNQLKKEKKEEKESNEDKINKINQKEIKEKISEKTASLNQSKNEKIEIKKKSNLSGKSTSRNQSKKELIEIKKPEKKNYSTNENIEIKKVTISGKNSSKNQSKNTLIKIEKKIINENNINPQIELKKELDKQKNENEKEKESIEKNEENKNVNIQNKIIKKNISKSQEKNSSINLNKNKNLYNTVSSEGEFHSTRNKTSNLISEIKTLKLSRNTHINLNYNNDVFTETNLLTIIPLSKINKKINLNSNQINDKILIEQNEKYFNEINHKIELTENHLNALEESTTKKFEEILEQIKLIIDNMGQLKKKKKIISNVYSNNDNLSIGKTNNFLMTTINFSKKTPIIPKRKLKINYTDDIPIRLTKNDKIKSFSGLNIFNEYNNSLNIDNSRIVLKNIEPFLIKKFEEKNNNKM